MLELEVLIGKLGSVNGLATGPVASCEVTSLTHKARDLYESEIGPTRYHPTDQYPPLDETSTP